jgi:hypothetical protein
LMYQDAQEPWPAPVICSVGPVVVIQSILGLRWPVVRCWLAAKFLRSLGSPC